MLYAKTPVLFWGGFFCIRTEPGPKQPFPILGTKWFPVVLSSPLFRVVIVAFPCNLFARMETITIEQLQELFAGLRSETSWNVDGEMLWGYFFISKDQEKLERAANTL